MKGQIFETPKNSNYFSGYYDRKIINNNKIILHQLSNDQLYNNDGDIELKVFDIKTKKEIYFTKSNCWNWQMGCNASWFKKLICFNFYNRNKICSKFISLIDNNSFYFDEPIYNIYGKFIVSINYYNISSLRKSYGYNLPIMNNNMSPYIKVFNENFKIINHITISLIEDCLKLRIKNSIIEHPFLDLQTKNLFFIFRDLSKNQNYMFVYNIDNENINYISMSHISHFCVKNDKLVFYGSLKEKEKILRKIYKKFSNLKFLEFFKNYLLDNFTNTDLHRYITNEKLFIWSLSQKKIINEFKIDDGHPNFLNSDQIIYDLYPNKFNKIALMNINIDNQKIDKMFEHKHNSKFINKSNRCDMHNKVNENYIVIDLFDTYRSVKIFKK